MIIFIELGFAGLYFWPTQAPCDEPSLVQVSTSLELFSQCLAQAELKPPFLLGMSWNGFTDVRCSSVIMTITFLFKNELQTIVILCSVGPRNY